MCSHAEAGRVPIRLPDIGAGDEPIRFGQWLVDEGDAVLTGDRLAEVLAGSVLFHVASPAEGTLIRGDAMPEGVLTVGAVLGVIDTQAAVSSGD